MTAPQGVNPIGADVGTFSDLPLANFRISPFCVVPKKEPKYRILNHLSFQRAGQ